MTPIDITAAWRRPGGQTTADTLTVDLDAEPMLHAITRAATEAVRTGIRRISASAAQATITSRRRAREAWLRGAEWARRRYPSGPPMSSSSLFNSSGRLAQALHALKEGDAWEVAIPGDRLGPTFTEGALERTLGRLRQLVPAIVEPLAVPSVAEAIDKALAAMVSVRKG